MKRNESGLDDIDLVLSRKDEPFQTPAQAAKQIVKEIFMPVEKTSIDSFPTHLFPPRGAKTVDLRNAATATVPPADPGPALNVNIPLLDFTVPRGLFFYFRAYAIYTDVPVGVDCEWFIKVNGTKILPFHGDPLDNYRMTLATSNDLGDPIDALVEIIEGQRITINAIISSISPGNSSTAGARIIGWLTEQRTALQGVGG